MQLRMTTRWMSALVGILSALISLAHSGGEIEADYVIVGGTLYDGSGAKPVVQDLAIHGERIVAIGKFATKPGAKIIEARNLVVAPGFIDLHTHSDIAIRQKNTRSNANYLYQGVTTIVTGNCGSGPINVAQYYAEIDKSGAGTNVGHLIPHNALRAHVMGNVNRPPSIEELRRMEELVERGMQEGAWGLSTGLIYNPGCYARTDEIIALARVVARYQGIYVSHIRDEGAGLLDAIQEAITIGHKAGLPVHISHIKCSGRVAWGKSADVINLIRKARESGLRITADQYPYIASSTSLAATLIPSIYREGSHQEMLQRLEDKEHGPRIRQAIEENIRRHQEGESIRIASYAKRPEWNGKSLAQIAKEQQRSALEIVLEIEHNGGASIVNFGMNEEDVRLYMQQEWVATASDGSATIPSAAVIHPRHYGTFPRKIGRYAITEKLISLEQAIRSASGLPADILQLPQRGYLRAGYYADIVVFHPAEFRDQATFEKPHQYSTGVRYLFVNGHLVISDGKYQNRLAGKSLRHQVRQPD
ncbi:MAG: D-aminoacylase [Gemmatales bacterium]|nr:D-aminoacylase [Gemmatales bacterium]MCS7159647.1 D-aminoacylase [Gemmatales bacterium]MDW8174845.1 D-aminoacylase [Gemmatales bacterium]MDW8223794.1 D-aminoacylase [Gemmatales bacterium]